MRSFEIETDGLAAINEKIIKSKDVEHKAVQETAEEVLQN